METNSTSTAPRVTKPYVPEQTSLRELTFKSIFLGVVMACVLGAANAYLGLRAGMTVSATFPAAVVAMAVLRIFKGSVLEENIARTTASVGEALVAGAIFTLPAFLLSGVWNELNYWESTLLMLVGGVVGVLFIIILRKPLVHDSTLPYPESVACAEIVKSGQKGETGAKYVFSAMGLGALIELFKNARGIQIFSETISGFHEFAKSRIQLFTTDRTPLGDAQTYSGGIFLSSPAASPALVGIGYIIGPRLAAIAFSGGVFGWWLLIPAVMFFNGGLDKIIEEGKDWDTITGAVWYYQVRPIAVGAMLVGVIHTLLQLRKPLMQGMSRAVRDVHTFKENRASISRLDFDIPFHWVVISLIVMLIPVIIVYYYFSGNFVSAIVAGLVLSLLGFLLAAVAGYLVGVMGGSNNPISGLTLTSLVITAVLMVALGVSGAHGVMAVLGVATVVCCALGIAGDMLQDLKIGQILGGTPWKMQVSEMIGVVGASFVLVWPMTILHQGTPGGIGGPTLPAPQAGLMTVISTGIVGGEMAWPLILMGVMFSVVLIMLRSPSPTLIAVGMYLPLETTFAIFVGGAIKHILDTIVKRRALGEEERINIENKGILLASGLVAGEALTGVILAGLYLAAVQLPHLSESPLLGLLVFPLLAVILIFVPLKNMSKRAEI